MTSHVRAPPPPEAASRGGPAGRDQAHRAREGLDVGKGPGRRCRAPGRPLQGGAHSTSLAELKKRLVNALRHAVCPLAGPEQELDTMIPLGPSQLGTSRHPVGTHLLPEERGAWRGPHGHPVTAAQPGPPGAGAGRGVQATPSGCVVPALGTSSPTPFQRD